MPTIDFCNITPKRKDILLNVPPILLNWCANFLHNRQQCVKVGHFRSNRKPVYAGVPRGTKLGPSFFFVMVNDLSTELPLYKYVDDCTVYETISASAIDSSILQQEIENITQWTSANNMKLNVNKTKEFTVSFLKNQPSLPPLTVNNQPLEAVPTAKLLGVILTFDLKWSKHVEYICSEASKRLYALRMLKRNGVPPSDLPSVYSYFIRPVLVYACPVWHASLSSSLRDDVEGIQRRAIRIIYPHLSYSQGLQELNLPTLFDRRQSLCRSFYKSNLASTSKIEDLIPKPVSHKYNFRRARSLPLFKGRTKRFCNSFVPRCVAMWDDHP